MSVGRNGHPEQKGWFLDEPSDIEGVESLLSFQL